MQQEQEQEQELLTRDTRGRYLERISLSFNPCLKNIRVGTIVSCVHKIEALMKTKFGEGWLRWCIYNVYLNLDKEDF